MLWTYLTPKMSKFVKNAWIGLIFIIFLKMEGKKIKNISYYLKFDFPSCKDTNQY